MLRYTIFALALLAGICVCLGAVIPDPNLQDVLKLTNEQPDETLSRQQRAAHGYGDFGGHGHGGHHHGGYDGHHHGGYDDYHGGYGGYGHHHHHSPYYGDGGHYDGYHGYAHGYDGYKPGFGIYFG